MVALDPFPSIGYSGAHDVLSLRTRQRAKDIKKKIQF